MVKKIIKTILLLCFVWTLVAFSELYYWRNADTYPTWLAKQLDVPFKDININNINNNNINNMVGYFDKVCGKKRGLLAVAQKKNGMFMRCDESLTATAWLDGVYKLNESHQKK